MVRRELLEELYEEHGVNWNKEYKKRCLYCKSPLKYASDKYGPSVFFCSKCDRKYVLRDTNGNLITEEKAIEKLKNAIKATGNMPLRFLQRLVAPAPYLPRCTNIYK